MSEIRSGVKAGRSAVYAGSFDPPTLGHKWMIEQGAMLFDNLHVAVAINPTKSPTFSAEERVEMLEEITREHDNVSVGYFTKQYTVHYARALSCEYLLRGLRNAKDYDDEQITASLNRDLAPEIQTVLLPGPEELLKVSSSNVKSLIGPEGWEEAVARYVPEFVFDALVKRFEQLRTQ